MEARLNYKCPTCGAELKGGFGEDVTCLNCNKTFETDYDHIGESIAAWITNEKVTEKKIGGKTITLTEYWENIGITKPNFRSLEEAQIIIDAHNYENNQPEIIHQYNPKEI